MWTSALFQNEDIRGIQCFQTESIKCLLKNYKQNIHHGLQCSLLLNFVDSRVSLIPSEISVKIMLAALSKNMAPKTYTAKITEEREPPVYFAYSPSLVKI
jgi:hypothetical protein